MMNKVTKQILLAAPRSRVWRALTSKTEFSAWFGHELLDEIQPGAVVRARSEWEGRVVEEPFFVVHAIEPETYFAFRWAPDELDASKSYEDNPKTLVEFRLEEFPGGTLLTHSESGYDLIPGTKREWLFRNDRGWTEQMRNLERYMAGKLDELSNQVIHARVEGLVAKPVAEVRDAIVDPAKMSQYFISRGSGRMTSGATLVWEWDDIDAKLDIEVLAVTDDTIRFAWHASGSRAEVTIALTPAVGGTKLVVTESQWRMMSDGIKAALGQTQGWTDFLCCLKAYVLFGVNLRTGRGAH